MKCTTSWASAASNAPSSKGSSSAAAWRTSTPGLRSRAAATNDSDGSMATTASGPTRSTSSRVSAPGPQPTSSVRCPATTPARSAICAASPTEYRPMKRSYASAATLNPIVTRTDARLRRGRRGRPGSRGSSARWIAVPGYTRAGSSPASSSSTYASRIASPAVQPASPSRARSRSSRRRSLIRLRPPRSPDVRRRPCWLGGYAARRTGSCRSRCGWCRAASARTSIGTSLSAIATNTSRWRSVSSRDRRRQRLELLALLEPIARPRRQRVRQLLTTALLARSAAAGATRAARPCPRPRRWRTCTPTW